MGASYEIMVAFRARFVNNNLMARGFPPKGFSARRNLT
jgi:hypothetical protein